jgi:drug/metabolite transporter (DMT)-like permease
MSALVLSLSAAALWGAADFFGGLSARKLPVLAVTLWSQLAGLVTITLVAVVAGASVSAPGALWGAGAGVVGAATLAVFYAALASGVMSLVAPISALGALVPVLVAVAGGERPGIAATAGMALALGGALLVSQARGKESVLSARALGLAVAAAAGIGIVLTFLQLGAQAEGSSGLAAAAAARAASVGVTVLLVVAMRTSLAVPAAPLRTVLLVGAADTGANALFASATVAGQDALVAVLGSLYPVVTVVLARLALTERLSGTQMAGVASALLGVALASL